MLLRLPLRLANVLVVALASGAMAQATSAPAKVEPLPMPEVNNARLTELAAQVVLVHNVPGLGIAVIDANGVHAFGAAGVRKAGSPDRLTTEDRFHIGSCGKVMTSVLLARLAEQGKLSWDDALPKLLPGVTMSAGFQKLTLRDLLTHRSGIEGKEDGDQLPFLRAGARDTRASRRALAGRILGAEPQGTPGTFSYANINYAIAGCIAESVADLPYEQLIKREVFDPLQMTTAGFGAPTGPQPWGHHQGAAGSVPVEPGPFADNPPGFAPAGTIHLSLRDWARFASVLLGGGPAGFLKPESILVLTTPPGKPGGPAYASGLGVSDTRGHLTFSHAGSNTMWFAQIILFPEEKWGILVTTNQAGKEGEDATTEVIQELVSLAKKER